LPGCFTRDSRTDSESWDFGKTARDFSLQTRKWTFARLDGPGPASLAALQPLGRTREEQRLQHAQALPLHGFVSAHTDLSLAVQTRVLLKKFSFWLMCH